MHDAENAKARPCMDFRTVDPGSIVWKRGGKAGAVIAVPKISVQTPTCACTISVHTAGMLRVDLKLGNRDIHRRFIEWIAAIEAGVRGTDDADDELGLGDAAMSSSVYAGNFKAMAFSDTLMFDDTGDVSSDATGAKRCAALVDLVGLWTTPTAWGLRWKLTQLKFSETPLHEDCVFMSDTASDTTSGNESDD